MRYCFLMRVLRYGFCIAVILGCACRPTPKDEVYVAAGTRYYYEPNSPGIPPDAKPYPRSQVVAQGYEPFSSASASADGGDTSSESGPKTERDAFLSLSGLNPDDTILVRFTTLEATQANQHFPLDGNGLPEFALSIVLFVLYEGQAVSEPVGIPLGEFKRRECFTAMESGWDLRIPVGLIRNRLKAYERAYGLPKDCSLEFTLVEDDYFSDDFVARYEYSLARDARKSLEISQRYITMAMNLYVFVEGRVDIERTSEKVGKPEIQSEISTNSEKITEEPDFPEVLTPTGFAVLFRRALLQFVGGFITLYVVLRWRGKISDDTLTALMQTAVVSLLLTAVHTLLVVFNLVALGNGAFTGLFLPLHMGVLILILYYYYGFNALEFLVVFLLNLLAQLCVRGITSL